MIGFVIGFIFGGLIGTFGSEEFRSLGRRLVNWIKSHEIDW